MAQSSCFLCMLECLFCWMFPLSHFGKWSMEDKKEVTIFIFKVISLMILIYAFGVIITFICHTFIAIKPYPVYLDTQRGLQTKYNSSLSSSEYNNTNPPVSDNHVPYYNIDIYNSTIEEHESMTTTHSIFYTSTISEIYRREIADDIIKSYSKNDTIFLTTPLHVLLGSIIIMIICSFVLLKKEVKEYIELKNRKKEPFESML